MLKLPSRVPAGVVQALLSESCGWWVVQSTWEGLQHPFYTSTPMYALGTHTCATTFGTSRGPGGRCGCNLSACNSQCRCRADSGPCLRTFLEAMPGRDIGGQGNIFGAPIITCCGPIAAAALGSTTSSLPASQSSCERTLAGRACNAGRTICSEVHRDQTQQLQENYESVPLICPGCSAGGCICAQGQVRHAVHSQRPSGGGCGPAEGGL